MKHFAIYPALHNNTVTFNFLPTSMNFMMSGYTNLRFDTLNYAKTYQIIHFGTKFPPQIKELIYNIL